MAKFAWKDVALVVGGADLSCDTSATSWELSASAEEVTAFCDDGVREYVVGLKEGSFSHQGFWDPVVTADAVYDRVRAATAAIPTSIAVTKTLGARAYTGQTIHTDYAESAEVGAPYNYAASGVMSGKVARGMLTHLAATVVTATGTGTAVEAGAAASGVRVYSALHLLELTGGTAPTVAVVAQSDDASAFSTPVARLTHTTLSAVGSDLQTLDGPVTDTWWRPSYTITGSPTAVRFLHVIAFATV